MSRLMMLCVRERRFMDDEHEWRLICGLFMSGSGYCSAGFFFQLLF